MSEKERKFLNARNNTFWAIGQDFPIFSGFGDCIEKPGVRAHYK